MSSELRVEEKCLLLLEELQREFGFDLFNDKNFHDTPSRMSKMFHELLSGYNEDPDKILSVDFPSGNYDQMIVVKDIEFYSLCSHHCLPFTGLVHVAYLPQDGKVVGVSKIVRVVNAYARRFQIQERMTMQIAECIERNLNASVAVVVEAQHLCMTMRGVKTHNSKMKTSAMLGAFRDEGPTRREFFDLIKK